MRLFRYPLLALLGLCLLHPALAETWTLHNPTGAAYVNEAVRLHLSVPHGPFTVTEDGANIPYQVETIDGEPYIWALVSMGKGESHTFATAAGQPAQAKPMVQVRQENGSYVLDNGIFAVKVPTSGVQLTAPVQAVRLPNGTWVGQGTWHTERALTRMTATVIGDGTVFAKVRVRYEFAGTAGVDGSTPAFAQVDVAVYPGQRHAVIEEAHAMSRDNYWEFDCAAGWGARQVVCDIFGGAAGKPKNPAMWPKDLKPLGWDPAAVDARYDNGDPRLGDTLLWLVPRANQHYEDGWYFAVGDGANAVGAMVCRAGKWVWPHENKIAISAKESADYAGLRCPTWRGTRYWYLVVGSQEQMAVNPARAYVLDHAFKGLDKILFDYITAWPEMEQKTGEAFYQKFNPINLKRGFATGFGNWGGGSPMDTLTAVQAMLDPDLYGSYWTFWSPTNPNFFTDFYKPAVFKAGDLKTHPRYQEIARLAEMKVREDVYHSITLPGGAGQECPGYMSYAMGSLRKLAEQCTQEFGTDPRAWDRLKAGESFLRHISQPDGAIRRFLPIGDTHPGKEGGPNPIDVPADEVKTYKTEELPGFGIVFHNKPGTPQETYLSFKSGPNRGHYHGDQLAFHYCANAKAIAVDHHCSYKPRAGQEHMHNRLAFFTDDMPFANMDGYERVIAFKPGADVDIAIGQVGSDRLRKVTAFPPEDWDRDYPRVEFGAPLQYRRTIVCMKGGAQDYFVIRDQYQADRPLHAAYCLHALDNDVVAFRSAKDQGGVADGSTTFRDQAVDFTAQGAQPGWGLYLVRPPVAPGEQRKETDEVLAAYRITAVNGHALTLDRPMAAGANVAYALVRDLDGPAASLQRVGDATLFRAWPAQADRKAFPWWHYNGGLEMTQGLRWEITGRSGEFITVLYPGAQPPAMTAIPGGVQVGDDRVTFAGGIDDQDATAYVTVARGQARVSLTGADIDMDRFQGDIGLFVPDTGYPFGDIPDWLRKQRLGKPDWYQDVLPLGYRR